MNGSKLVFGISFVFMLLAVGYFGYVDKPAAMALGIAAGAIGMAFSNLEKFSRIKGAGFEAELKKAVEDAYATTSSLKKLAGALSHAVLGLVAGEGRWGGMGYRRKLELKAASDVALKELGLSDAEIEGSHAMFDAYLLWDHGLAITQAMSKHPNVDNDVRADLSKLADYRSLSVANADEFRNVAQKHSIDDPAVMELIADFQHFQSTRALRRPDVWFNQE
jgi:hypothetical protein